MQVKSVALFAIPRTSWILIVTVLCKSRCPRDGYTSRGFDEGQLTQWNKTSGANWFWYTPNFYILCVYRTGLWSYMRQLQATVPCIIEVVERQGWPPCAAGKDDVSSDKGLENLVCIYLGHSLMQIVSCLSSPELCRVEAWSKKWTNRLRVWLCNQCVLQQSIC